MNIGQKNIYIDGMTWHCLSIFYARKNCILLLKAISDFCEINKNLLKHWSFYFSEEQGESINLVFISEEQNSQILTDMLEEYFELFLKEKPSEDPCLISYGSILWVPYPNNSFAWNAFEISLLLQESQKMRYFFQATSLLIVNLFDKESSYEENTVSIATFLHVQLLKKQNTPLPEIANPELAETIKSYWDYEENELLVRWLQYADIATASSIIRSQLNYWMPNLI